ncbi:MAG: acyl carrier protein, partial [Clostridia bacterium]|nr:acyl carrier protein [Clostridia bacterium]
MVFEKLRALIVETLEIDEDKITMDATFDDLMLDSLDLVELVMAAEDEFDIHVEDDALDGLETIGDVVDLLT